MLVADMVMMAHVGYMAVAEDGIFQKLKLIGLTPDVGDVVAEDAVHIMALEFEEDCIDS